MKGLDPTDKATRVANFHEETIKSFVELMAASGVCKPEELTRKHINRRVSMNNVLKYSEIFPEIVEGSYN
jgi:glutamate synthase domain-containing protein 2